jgi:hypothetical protein
MYLELNLDTQVGMFLDRRLCLQDFVDNLCSGAVIAALQLYSDQTCLSFDRRITGWAFVMTLGNIKLSKRREPDGHVLLGIFPTLKAVAGHPGEVSILLTSEETQLLCEEVIIHVSRVWRAVVQFGVAS